jgi:hypothetical protein
MFGCVHDSVYLVMRLTKPSLMMSQPLSCVSTNDLFHDAFNEVIKSDISIEQELPHFALGSMLTLPQNFGLVIVIIQMTFSCITDG